MVTTAQRSRACSECRKRRVKCDLTPGECYQCYRLGRVCDGPNLGPLFIAQKLRTSKPKGRRKRVAARAAITGEPSTQRENKTVHCSSELSANRRSGVAIMTSSHGGNSSQSNQSTAGALDIRLSGSSSNSRRERPLPSSRVQPCRGSPGLPSLKPPYKPSTLDTLDMPQPNPMSPIKRRYAQDLENSIAAIRYLYPLFIYKPTSVLRENLDAAFLTHYVEHNNGTRTYAPEMQWVVHLPGIASKTNNQTLKTSLRAMSLAFYGKRHRNPSILLDSWHWYSDSVNAHRKSISRLSQNAIPDEEDILIPLILALYKIHIDEAPSSTVGYLVLATKIMNMRGPRHCKSGVILTLFKGLRKSDAYRAIVFNKRSVYSSHTWMTVPFVGRLRDVYQWLADIELTIPHCMASLQIQGDLRAFFKTRIPPNVNVGLCYDLTRKLIADLNDWTKTYPTLTNISGRTFPGLPDPFIAPIVSNYAATRLLLNMLMYKMSTESNIRPVLLGSAAPPYLAEATRCAQVILDAAAEVDSAQTPSFDLLRNVAPVFFVACTAPTPQLGNDAGELMQRWATKIAGFTMVWQHTKT